MAMVYDISYAGSIVVISAPLQGFPAINCSLEEREDSFGWEEDDVAVAGLNASFEMYYFKQPKPRRVTISVSPTSIGAEQIQRMIRNCYPQIAGTLTPPHDGITLTLTNPRGRITVMTPCVLIGGTSMPTGKGDGSFGATKVKLAVGGIV